MYQFVSGFINITDDVEWQVCTTLLVSHSPFASDLTFVCALILMSTFSFEVSKYDYYT